MTKNQPAAPAWAENLLPGAIALFRFPEREDDLGGKKRPCLVLATRSQPNGLHVSLAYGTSVDSHANRGFDISIDSDDCEAVGTRRATRFVLARRINVSVNDSRFDVGTEDNPIVGQLLDDQMGQLRALAGFLGDRVFEDAIPARAASRRSGVIAISQSKRSPGPYRTAERSPRRCVVHAAPAAPPAPSSSSTAANAGHDPPHPRPDSAAVRARRRTLLLQPGRRVRSIRFRQKELHSQSRDRVSVTRKK